MSCVVFERSPFHSFHCIYCVEPDDGAHCPIKNLIYYVQTLFVRTLKRLHIHAAAVLAALYQGKMQTTHLVQPHSHSSMHTWKAPVRQRRADEAAAGHLWCLYSGWTRLDSVTLGRQCELYFALMSVGSFLFIKVNLKGFFKVKKKRVFLLNSIHPLWFVMEILTNIIF